MVLSSFSAAPILHSSASDKFYIGYTADLEGRLRRHASANTGFTSTGKPWNLVFSGEFSSAEKARKREKQLKNRKNHERLKQRVVKYLQDIRTYCLSEILY